MKIGIIGAGNIGSALATVLVPLGHEVVIANSRGPETLADVAQRTGATAVTNVEAARGRDLVVVTIPQLKVPDLPSDLFAGVPEDVVVIDTNNYYPQQRDGRIARSRTAPPRRAGLPINSAARQPSRRSTTSTPSTSRPAAAPQATPSGSPCPTRATTTEPTGSSPASSTRSASSRCCRAAWTSPGASSPARRYTAPT
jgi:hypothetical protein